MRRLTKSFLVIFFSFLFTLFATRSITYADRPKLRPSFTLAFKQVFARITFSNTVILTGEEYQVEQLNNQP